MFVTVVVIITVESEIGPGRNLVLPKVKQSCFFSNVVGAFSGFIISLFEYKVALSTYST